MERLEMILAYKVKYFGITTNLTRTENLSKLILKYFKLKQLWLNIIRGIIGSFKTENISFWDFEHFFKNFGAFRKNIYFQPATPIFELNLEMTSFKKSPSLNAIKVRFVRELMNSKGSWFYKSNHNQFHNISRLFNVLPNFPFTASETMGIITYKHGI